VTACFPGFQFVVPMTKLYDYKKWDQIGADESDDDDDEKPPTATERGMLEPDASYLEGIEASDAEEIFRKQQEVFAREGEEERLREKDPLAPGRWVTLQDLKASHLNCCDGEIIRKKYSDGRVGVRLKEHGDKLIRAENLRSFSDLETVKLARVGARGEENGSRGPGGVRTWRWPRSVLEELVAEISPISELIGFPLKVARVESHIKLTDPSDFDNQWASSFMVDPISGLAPVQWQTDVGPVVMWRQDGGSLSADDAGLLQSFISDLLAMYPGVKVSETITPQVFQEFKRCKLEKEKLNPHMEQSEDVNI